MAVGFRRAERRFELRLPEPHALLLRQLATELLELLGNGAPPVPTDPLEALVGMAAEPVDPPDDPVLARLLPDAYGDDETAAADFRRYTEPGLRAHKRGALKTLLGSLPERGGDVRLDAAQAEAWLTALNDLRLALGTRLGVTEDLAADVAGLDDDDPRVQGVAIYEWLGLLEETLVQSLADW